MNFKQKPILPIIKWLWAVAAGNRLQTLLNAVIGIASVVMSLVSVYVVRNAIDIASHALEGDIYTAIAWMGAVIIIDFALSISGIYVRNILGVKAQNRMQQKMLERVLRSEWSSRKAMHSGDIVNRLEGDVNVVVGFLTETMPGALSTSLLFIGAFCYLYSMDSTLALITIAVVPLCVVMSKFYVKKMRRLNRQVRDSDSKIQSVMQEIVQHTMLIRTLEGDQPMIGRLTESHRQLRQNIVSRTLFSVLSNLTLNLGFALSYLLTFAWSAIRLSQGTLSFGGMTAFLQLVSRIQGPARSLAKLLPQSVAVITAAERLMELEDIPEETEGEPIFVQPPCCLHLKNVSFRYDDNSPWVLKDFNYTFRPGTATAVMGGTGAGKTTLIRMLLALTKPQQGSATIASGTAPQKEETLTHLHRCNFVYVPQGNTLMSGTIRENLLLAKPEATDDEMRNALHTSCADFVLSLPDGLDTVCSEHGGGLSEGQAQRIAIARALLRDRPVMLFDEATSALDAETEEQLLQNILATRKKTIVFITHRKMVCRFCDDILKVDSELVS